ncbi:MAG TPA: hypothetical protein VII49_07340 [Rhizomicrobium sp.]
MTDTVVIAEDNESTGYRFSWGLAIAGGVAATAVTFFLLTLGSGFGLLLVNPVTRTGPSLPAFLTGGAIYFFAAQAFGFAVGGHVVGRLLGPLTESRIQEDVRAAAHGLISWAVTILATLSIIVLAALTAANSGAATAGLYGAGPRHAELTTTAYLVDVLFRPAAAETRDAGSPAAMAAHMEAARILDAGMARGAQIAPEDRARLAVLVAKQAGISEADSTSRIDRMQADIQNRTKHAADIARKAASYAALWLAFAMLFGAIVSVAAAIYARDEDDRDALKA